MVARDGSGRPSGEGALNDDGGSSRASALHGSDWIEPAFVDDGWAALCAAEDAAIAARRRQVLGEAANGNPAKAKLPRVGLALSGGGLRSTRFLLGRLDYLSTVFGGGYAGGMFGRLVATYGLHRAQALMARAGSPVLDGCAATGAI